MLGNLFIF